MRQLKITLYVIAGFQAVLGAAFLLAPSATADLFTLSPPAAPAWANWLFAMMGARFLGYAYGLVLAARDPAHATSWIDSMIAIQCIDWIATVAALAAGDVTLRQVTTAAVAPLAFVAALAWFHPRRLVARSADAAPAST